MGSRRQFGSVRKLPSGRWQASYWHSGNRHIAPITFAFKADANAYLSSVETEVRRGLWIDPNGAQVLFADWAEEWTATTVDLRRTSGTCGHMISATPPWRCGSPLGRIPRCWRRRSLHMSRRRCVRMGRPGFVMTAVLGLS
jgi:hypothetical protein